MYELYNGKYTELPISEISDTHAAADTPSATLFLDFLLANRSLDGIEQFAFRGAPLNEVELLYLNNSFKKKM